MKTNYQLILNNTLILYSRMAVTLVFSFLFYRIILKNLGVADFGIYNVVAGVVFFFSFIRGAAATALQRYFNIEMEKDGGVKLPELFSASVKAIVIIAAFSVCLVEITGIPVVNFVLKIPADRRTASCWLLQSAVIMMVISYATIPLQALITAKEKINVIAWLNIIEIVIKVIAVAMLAIIPIDALAAYGILMIVCYMINLGLYYYCCKKTFPAISYSPFTKNAISCKELLSFSGWTLCGNIANIGVLQGLDFAINIFFGVLANAAYGIAKQVNNFLNGFINNCKTPYTPQLMQLYANGAKEELNALVFRASKLTTFLTTLIAIPLLINVELFLKVWLGNVPDGSVYFVILAILGLLIEAPFGVFEFLISANGEIKKYQIINSLLLLLTVPLAFAVLSIGLQAWSVLLIRDILMLITCIWRMIYVSGKTGINAFDFFKKICLAQYAIATAVLLCILPMKYFLHNWMLLFASGSAATILTTGLSYYLVLSGDERKKSLDFIRKHLILNR